MFLTSVLMFLMSSTLWSLDIVNIILPMRQIFDNTEAGIEKSYSNLNQIRWFWQSFVFTLEVRTTYFALHSWRSEVDSDAFG